MPNSLVRQQFSQGWNPSQDAINGSPEALLRMDNLRPDETGALTLAKGFKNINGSQFPGFVHSVWASQVTNIKHRFVGLSTGQVLHDSGGGGFGDEVISAGNPARARFSSILGSIFVSSGAKKAKTDGTTTRKWGVETPNAKVECVINNQPSFDVSGADGGGNFSTWELAEGVNFVNSGTYAQADTDPDTFRIIMGNNYGTKDFTAWPGGGKSTDTDTFNMLVRIGDTTSLTRVRIEFLLGEVSDLSTGSSEDYYWTEWEHDTSGVEFVEGINAYTKLTRERSAFVKQGTNNDLSWANVGAIRVTFVCSTSNLAVNVQDIKWSGSTLGPLNSPVDYIQVNVRDDGTYVAKSAISPKFDQFLTTSNASAQLTPVASTDTQINQKWFFRRGGLLQSFTRIGVLNLTTGIYTDSTGATQASSGTIIDTCPDQAAQDLNILANERTISMQDVPDEIFGIVDGIYYERAVMCTQGEILLSERLNPDAVDNGIRLRVSGDRTESLFWIEKLSESTLLVASSKTFYLLSGTLVDLPDGSVDAKIVAIGESHPPLGLEYAVDSNRIFYVASDGIRETNGGQSILISPQLNELFKRDVLGTNRYEIAQIAIYTNALTVYPISIANGQIFVSLPLTSGERQMFVYHILSQTWRLQENNAICLFREEDGTLIGGYGSPGDYYIKILDYGSTIDTTPGSGGLGVGQRVFLQTIWDSNQQPRNRKDAYTLKLQIDTGGQNVNVYLSGDNGGFALVGVVNSDGIGDFSFDIFDNFTQVYGLGFRYSLRLTSDFVLTNFRLTMFAIEYDPRPEQQTHLRILPTNLGSYARKRFTNFAFVIDTLGNTVNFNPSIDNTNVESVDSFIHGTKLTFVYYFRTEQIGTDIGGLISATGVENSSYPGVFEFYGINLEEIVSEKLPVPTKFLRIPNTNYGTPNRKRHSSYKFQIDTRGQDVRFTPILDGVSLTPATYNTSGKITVEYYFSTDTTGIDIGGTLASLSSTPFEFYGTIAPQDVEVLPPRLKEFRIPENNFGVASKKRVRTLPLGINTNGHDVVYTPIVDGSSGTPTILNSATRKTLFHYFDTDSFGVDYSGELTGDFPFEFYGMMKPEVVEILPVSKLFDQIGPVHFARIGKIVGFRVRIITGEVVLPWSIYAQDQQICYGSLTTVADVDDVYEEEFLTKSRNTTITRFTLGPTTVPFNRYWVEFKVNFGSAGNNTEIKWIKTGAQDSKFA